MGANLSRSLPLLERTLFVALHQPNTFVGVEAEEVAQFHLVQVRLVPLLIAHIRLHSTIAEDHAGSLPLEVRLSAKTHRKSTEANL